MKTLSLFLVLSMSSYSIWAQTFTNYSTEEGLLNNNVLCVTVDAENKAWFGTQSGISVFDGSNWTNYQKDNYPGMADDNILSIYAAKNGDLWIGTDFGASVYNGTDFTSYTTADGLGNDKVQCIAEDANGTIWFGTITGLSSFNGTDWTTYGTSEGLPFGGISSITLHSSGDLWLGTGLGGIAVFDGDAFSSITEDEGLVSDKVRAIAVDANDNKWVGTADGLSLLNGDNTLKTNYTRIFTLPEPDTLNPIEALAIGSDGVVWAGVYVDYLVTEGGVCAYNGTEWFQYEVEDGLAGPVIRGLAIDTDNNVWVATSTGVTQISDHSLSASSPIQASLFAMYPNPAQKQVNLQFSEALNANRVLRLYDASMKEIMQQTVAPQLNSTMLPLEGLTPGVYYLQVDQQMRQLLISE